MIPAINFEGETFNYYVHDYHHSYATRIYLYRSNQDDRKEGFLLDTTACCEQHQQEIAQLIRSEQLHGEKKVFIEGLFQKAKQNGWLVGGDSFRDKPILSNKISPPISLHVVDQIADFSFKLCISSLRTDSSKQVLLNFPLDGNVQKEQIEALIQHCGGEHLWRDAGIDKPLFGGINIYHKEQQIMQHGCCSLIDRWRTWQSYLDNGASPWNGHGPYCLFQKTESGMIQIGYWKQREPDCWNDFVSDIAQEYFDDQEHDEELDDWLPEYAHFTPLLEVSINDYKTLVQRLEADIHAFVSKVETYLEKKEMANMTFLQKVKLKWGNQQVMTKPNYQLSADLRKWLHL